MKARAMQAVEDAYIAQYGQEALQDEQQRIAFGEWLCAKKKQVFQFKGILENVCIQFQVNSVGTT
jgi:hypothetical protein